MLVPNIEQWERHGITKYYAKQWLRNGFSIENAKNLRKEGFTPQSAKKVIIKEIKNEFLPPKLL